MRAIWQFCVNFCNQKSTSYLVLKYMSLACITCYFARVGCCDHVRSQLHLNQTKTDYSHHSENDPGRFNPDLYPLTSEKALQPLQSTDLAAFVFPMQVSKQEKNTVTIILNQYGKLRKLADQITCKQSKDLKQMYQTGNPWKDNDTKPCKKISTLQKQLIDTIPFSLIPLTQHLKVLSLCATLAVTDEVREKILEMLLLHPHKTNLFAPLARTIFINANTQTLKQMILNKLFLAPESTKKTFFNQHLFAITQAIDQETYAAVDSAILDQLSNKKKLEIILSSLAHAPIKSTFWDLELEKTDQQETTNLKCIGLSLEKTINNYISESQKKLATI